VSLVAELFSRNANLLFLDEEGRVLATLRRHEGRINQPYEAPSTPLARLSSQEIAPPEHAILHPLDTEAFPLSAELETRYREREAELSRLTQVRERESALRKNLKKLLRRADALRRDLEQAGLRRAPEGQSPLADNRHDDRLRYRLLRRTTA
jgi:predicted ribosome quality control (RQC) complex YloA/Tae2 family protein